MINHVTLYVNNFEKSRDFFVKTLKPLGYKLLNEFPEEKIAGFGIKDEEGERDLWIKEKEGGVEDNSLSCLAFTALDKDMVNEFYKVGLEAGGEDNGKPGYRKKYHPGYYAAYVFDPDGNNIEAVFDDFSKLDKEE